ncbi:hypothetical protein MTP99_011687 [Tenebrio molitor]|nr:hypothetical protein MTP99_011687 [Tenebrio molitor]
MAFRTDGWRPLEVTNPVKFYSSSPLTILEASCHLGQVRRDKASRNESHSMSESVRFGQDVRKAFKTHLGEVARRQAGPLDVLGGGGGGGDESTLYGCRDGTHLPCVF